MEIEQLINELKAKSNIPIIPLEREVAVSNDILKTLRPIFEKEFETTDFSFELPEDFKAFIEQFGDEAANLGGTYGMYVWSAKGVIINTEIWLGDFHIKRSRKEAWVCVGEYSDKHWYFLCCDATSPNFGKVADGYDNTPWNDYEMLDIDDESFISFLNYAIRH